MRRSQFIRQLLSKQQIIKMADNNEIILYQPDETIKLEVRLENETVWLTQQQMAELFGTQRQAITKHLKNIWFIGQIAGWKKHI